MVLESPFYGARKPHYQFASQLLRVSDLLTLGRSTIEESLCLLDWAGRHGFARLGITAQDTFTSLGHQCNLYASATPVSTSPLLNCFSV